MGRRYQRVSTQGLKILWTQWQAGHDQVTIGRAIAHPKGTVHSILTRYGGIAPPERHRAPQQLTLADREEISRGLAQEGSFQQIAAGLGRPTSTVSREVRRNGGRAHYRAARAEAAAWGRGARPKRCRLATHRRLRDVVAACLAQRWSPAQIAAWLQRTYPDDPAMHVSPETIYRTLYVQTRGALKRELLVHLRQRHRLRQSARAAAVATRPGQLRDVVSIRARPASAEDRAIPGHWEGDLVLGAAPSQIATLVERHSRYVMLVRVPARDSATVVQALARRVQRLPAVLKQSLTWDQGKELAQHRAFTIATDVQVYFCDPQSPWQRGSNENTNGLLRQYFPKGMDVSAVSQRQLDAVARQLNTRPRQTLGWRTPADVLNAAIAFTG